MNQGQTLFAQVMSHAPHRDFQRCVQRYEGDRRARRLRCWDHFLIMGFAQLSYRESLRDIEACLRARPEKLYHMGIRSGVSRNTLAVANEKRDWRIYAEFAQVLIREARRLYSGESFGADLDELRVYALDSTTIDLCLSLFPWAHFRRTKAAIKLHTVLDLRGNIPTFIWMTDGKVHDVHLLDQLLLEPGAIYVMDRGYVDFGRLHLFTRAQAIFVTRAKKNLRFRRRYSHSVDRSTGLICDQTIVLTVAHSAEEYPDPLRRIRYKDPLQGSRDRQDTRFSDQQLCASSSDHRRVVPKSLADRAVLQVDQAAPSDQSLLRHLRERGEDPDLDRDLDVPAGGDPEEAARAGA